MEARRPARPTATVAVTTTCQPPMSVQFSLHSRAAARSLSFIGQSVTGRAFRETYGSRRCALPQTAPSLLAAIPLADGRLCHYNQPGSRVQLRTTSTVLIICAARGLYMRVMAGFRLGQRWDRVMGHVTRR